MLQQLTFPLHPLPATEAPHRLTPLAPATKVQRANCICIDLPPFPRNILQGTPCAAANSPLLLLGVIIIDHIKGGEVENYVLELMAQQLQGLDGQVRRINAALSAAHQRGFVRSTPTRLCQEHRRWWARHHNRTRLPGPARQTTHPGLPTPQTVNKLKTVPTYNQHALETRKTYFQLLALCSIR